MRTFMLAVTGFLFAIAACSSYGTSVVEVKNTRAAVASVFVKIPLSLVAGQTARATATPKDANGNALTDRPVAWFTSSGAVASVDDSGTIAAVAPGSAILSAVSEGVAAQATMSVIPRPTPIANLAVAVNPSAVVIGQTAHASAIIQDSAGAPISGDTVIWESSNVAVATVTAAGDVKAVAAGNTMIKGSSRGKSAAAALAVSAPAPVPVATVAVSPATASLNVAGTVQLSATTRDANNNVLSGRIVAWSSSNAGVSTVSSTGLVTAVAAGAATVTASSEGKTSSAAITVNSSTPIPVASVSVSPSTANIQVGGTSQLSVVTRDAGNNVLTGRVVTWSSSNTAIVSVSNSGLVTAVAAGTATVTANSEGTTGTATITVAVAPVASVGVAPATATISVGQTRQLTATLRDGAGNVLTGRTVTWTSNTPSIATVSANGLVNGVAAGQATITANSGSANGTAGMTVTAPVPPPTGGGGPEPGAGDVIVYQDGFDRATITDQMAGYSAAPGDYSRVTDGHIGAAIRVSYNAGNWNNVFGTFIDPQTDAYYRYWYRTSPGADPTCGFRNQSGFKWFMTQRNDPYPRYTHGVGQLPGGPPGNENTGMEFSTHDNSSVSMPNPFMSNINKTKRFDTTNDGQWHEYTIHVVVGTGGYEQIWIDGVKVLDSQGYGYDHSPQPIILFGFPGNMVQWYSGCDFTVDIDDLAIWHK